MNRQNSSKLAKKYVISAYLGLCTHSSPRSFFYNAIVTIQKNTRPSETKAGVIEFYRVCMQMDYSNYHNLKIKIVWIGTETLIFVQTVDLFDFLSG